MGRTFLRQDAQIRNSVSYDDTLAAGSTLESSPTTAEGDFNAVRSQLKRALYADNAGDWFADINVPSTFESGAKRGIRNLNTDLHELERKRVLTAQEQHVTDVTVTAAQNWQMLTLGQLPANTTAAIGAVTTRGTVAAAHGGTFNTHALSLVTGASAINPKNLCEIIDAASHDPILSSGRIIYALFHTESSTDGSTMSGTTPNRAQLSFVRLNAGGTALEACPVADIENKVIHFASVERKALEDLNEQDFLRGASTDAPASTTVTRQEAYNNQGITPVDVTTHSYLDLEGAGLQWIIRDDLQANLLRVMEGSAGGTSEVQLGLDVDVFNVDAVVNDFRSGLKADTNGTEIDIGVTAGTIETLSANDLKVKAGGELYLDDGNQAGSTWAQTAGIKLSDTLAEWDAFETAYGEVSLLSAIVTAKNSVARNKTVALVTTNVAADTDVGGTGGGANLDAQLGDYSGKTFVTDVDIYLNGQLLRNGANAAANHDVYPGTSPALGQLKFEFGLHASPGNADVITMLIW